MVDSVPETLEQADTRIPLKDATTLKGREFTLADLPRSAHSKMNEEQMLAWCDRMTARYAVIAIDPDAPEGRREIIAEELMQRVLNRLSPKARRAAGMLMRTSQDVRAELLAAFDSDGDLKNPFNVI